MKDEYFVPIKLEFLLDTYKQFKSEYTPWIYLILKIKNYYYMTKAPNVMYQIDRTKIAQFLEVNESTIHHCFKELVSAGLLEKSKSKYRLRKEDAFINTYERLNNIDTKKKLKFLQIFGNDFFKFSNDVYKVQTRPHMQRMVIKALRIFYYLYADNRHCYNIETGIVESTESQSSIARNLKHDPTTVKAALKMLEEAGYIKLDSTNGISFTISTLNKNTFDAKWDEKKKQEELELVTPKYKYIEGVTAIQNNSNQNAVRQSGDSRNNTLEVQPEVPKNFIGFGKYTLPPYKRMHIYYANNKKDICQGLWGESDGIPPTDQEIEIQESLICSGHKSRYYKKDDYWKYPKTKTDAKAA